MLKGEIDNMLIVYAVMDRNKVVEDNDKRLNVELDRKNLNKKNVLMDYEYFIKHGKEYNNSYVTVIGNSDIDNNLDDMFKQEMFKKDFYVVGSNTFLESIANYIDEALIYVVKDKVNNPTLVFPDIINEDYIVDDVMSIQEDIVKMDLIKTRKKKKSLQK